MLLREFVNIGIKLCLEQLELALNILEFALHIVFVLVCEFADELEPRGEGWLTLEVHARPPQSLLDLHLDQLFLVHFFFFLDELDLLGLAREAEVVVSEDRGQLNARLERALQRDVFFPLLEHFPALGLPEVALGLYLLHKCL